MPFRMVGVENINPGLLSYMKVKPGTSAERQGFEPWEQLPVHRISSAARSTTPASFLIREAKLLLFFLSAC